MKKNEMSKLIKKNISVLRKAIFIYASYILSPLKKCLGLFLLYLFFLHMHFSHE